MRTSGYLNFLRRCSLSSAIVFLRSALMYSKGSSTDSSWLRPSLIRPRRRPPSRSRTSSRTKCPLILASLEGFWSTLHGRTLKHGCPTTASQFGRNGFTVRPNIRDKGSPRFRKQAFLQGLFYRLKIVRLTKPHCGRAGKLFPYWPLTSSRNSAERCCQTKCEAFSPTVPLDSCH